MKLSTIGPIAIAIIAVVIVAAWAYSAPNTNDTSLSANGNGTPKTISTGDEHVSLSASYAGAGNASYIYDTDTAYDLNLTVAPSGSWSGSVVIHAFVDKVGEFIGPDCIVLRDGGKSVDWNFTSFDGRNIAHGNVTAWTTDGSSKYDRQMSFLFNTTGTGTYNITLQAFDADGNAISQPLYLAPMDVPVAGSLSIERVGNGGFTSIDNTSYYEVVLDVTNDWNVEHSVNVQNLTLSVDGIAILPDQDNTKFSTQMLEPGQITQFQVFFPVTETSTAITLSYNDNGNVINIPLS